MNVDSYRINARVLHPLNEVIEHREENMGLTMNVSLSVESPRCGIWRTHNQNSMNSENV